MVATQSGLPGDYIPNADQRVVMHGVPWSHYEVVLAIRGDRPVPRIAYLEGALELMTPSRTHEGLKSMIGRLVEAFALETGLDLSPYGSWTLRNARGETGAEPDECYLIGDQNKDVPDLVIEVIWTSGGIDKLEIYRRLGVNEVWFWRGGAIEVYLLRGKAYERSMSSACLPELDVDVLASFLDRPTATQAVREFRETLRAKQRR